MLYMKELGEAAMPGHESETPLEFARRILQIWKPSIPLDADTFIKEQKKICGQGILISGKDENGKDAFLAIIGDREEEKVNALVEEAHRDPIAFEAARELAADGLLKPEIIPEPSLRKFAHDYVAGKIKKPTRKGPSKYGNTERDKCFAYLSYKLQKKFACPFYSEISKKLQSCACGIIIEAATLESITVSYEAVRTAWNTWRHLYPPLQ